MYWKDRMRLLVTVDGVLDVTSNVKSSCKSCRRVEGGLQHRCKIHKGLLSRRTY